MRIYLSGAIEYSPDFGRQWRAELTPFLHELGHEVYDPALDEHKNLEEDEVRGFREWKRTDLERFQRAVRKIIAYDLDWIERKTDAVVCYWDEHCSKGAGTQAELTFAYRMGLPVHLIAAMPIHSISGWILGCSTHIYRSVAEFEERFEAARQEVKTT
jgi:hypothetical protein